MMNGFWENIFKKAGDNEDNVLKLLREIPILDDLSDEELREFERIAHHRYFETNEHIFWEGEPGVGMYIVKKGVVKIYKASADGKNDALAILKDGDFFGELALLDESPRSASAIAMEVCHILGFFRPEFFSVLERKPRLGLKVAMKLARIIGKRLRVTSAELQSITTRLHKPENLTKIILNGIEQSGRGGTKETKK
ncbi:MAG: cyclic nucleotide-binding domain-containing protein [Candidatus Brocadia sp. AMX2]|uniref:cAMP-binding proteins n=1 Tax=Candidatus Brocadia sinica JPN1 TaxID=1197129 RepID=A0ABQ0K077_9BACT|nr:MULTISPECIES: cyclic nucleotide-binding domain-containing protein [Brocadia]KXK33036.1 MAG: transcriptional regulator of Crp/Fnr family protein [Candidatus Brocadia sinica]MBC6934122.1 cyclic nucleotide-binding domain-containing protein [Candidatus Brocadia sp.]MBL1169391.1 cyclic nucleotide-binding domain-containing protein [Candidatus Brocadia sp. AMX1]NOG42295.1 cyclic nucleotide-binding domain-containing protein [Planctomycetota bacterium]KAA0241213.1 MAG: cyclic nucleotide-binding doma